jgi:HlyD family secretion protein
MSPAGRLMPVPDRDTPPIAPVPPAPVTARNGSLLTGLSSSWKRWRRLVLVLLAIAAAIVVLRLTVLAPKALRVEVARLTRGTVEETVTNTRAGTIKARRRARLSPETAGRVVALPFREGARVTAGTTLLVLDSIMQRAQLDLAREDVRAAGARVEEVCLGAGLAKTELGRVQELKGGGIASDQLLDRAQSESDRAQAACRAAGATLDQTRARERLMAEDLARTELRAPFAGIVAELHTELGEWITPAPPGIPVPPAIEILDPTSLYVTAPIDEMDAERVSAAQEVRISVDSRRGERFPGHLVRVAPYVQDVLEQNRTVEVEAEFDDTRLAPSLLPGTSADVEIILSRREGVLQVPTTAVSQGDTVLAVEGGRLVERTVKTGLRNWRSTEILGGLAEGDRVVVTRDSPEIKAGARVVIGGPQ